MTTILGGRNDASRPDPDVEKQSRGNGPVTNYMLSPEELARYRAMPVEKQKKPAFIPQFVLSPEEQSRRANIRYEKENDEMDKTKFTKEEYLAMRISGLSRKEIAKNKLYPVAHLENYWLKKWGIKDPDQEEMALIEAVGSKAAPKAETVSKDAGTTNASSQETDQRITNAYLGERRLQAGLDIPKVRAQEGIIIKPGVSGAKATVKDQPEDKLAAVQKYIRDLLGMDPVQEIYDQIAAERDRQDELHPLPKGFPLDLRMEILIEEVGEVAKAKLERNQLELRKELIEVAAVAVRWVEMLDREGIENARSNSKAEN